MQRETEELIELKAKIVSTDETMTTHSLRLLVDLANNLLEEEAVRESVVAFLKEILHGRQQKT